MNKEEQQARLLAYLLDELGAQERQAVEEQLAQSQSLRDEAEALKSTVHMLQTLAQSELALDESQRQKVREAAKEQTVTSAEHSSSPLAWLKQVPGQWWAAAALSAAAVGSVMIWAGGVATVQRFQGEESASAKPFERQSDNPVAFNSTTMEFAKEARPARNALRRSRRKQATAADPLTGIGYGSGGVVAAPASPNFNTERYAALNESGFQNTISSPFSTFSIDVDTASYSVTRRHLQNGELPPTDAVRIEELLNYFRYDYPEPKAGKPFSVSTDLAKAPWQPQHRLLRVALKGREIAPDERKRANLVFLIDVSGSMADENKLPLLKRGFKMLTESLKTQDRVAIVVYAGASGVVLPSTPGNQRQRIDAALDELYSGGSTNGGEGINLAYHIAKQNFDPEGINRVILATDGDFNVGQSSDAELKHLIEKHAQSGVFLSVLGFGEGNYNDAGLEQLADRGNGNYAYIDNLREARKVLVEQLAGTLITIAKDVKIQVEFNPKKVASYRLIGYENRRLSNQDFNDDSKDAGEIGAGHTVTALYEIVPVGVKSNAPSVDPLKYQKPAAHTVLSKSDEWATVKLRYKEPRAHQSKRIEHIVSGSTPIQMRPDFAFAAAVAEFGLLLSDSSHKARANLTQVLTLARQGSAGPLANTERREFIELVKAAMRLKG
ncbi:MAG: von Willebrand factor type A domain-containing protein [Myxococcales bacterium]|nr:MAG: von Willebrand factor type A domain-containing protein [Myxococcales bacterium]